MHKSQGSDIPSHMGLGPVALWIAVISLSGAGSLAAVRLATPNALDEKVATFVLFFALPGLLILLLRALLRPLGIALAFVLPVFWLALSRDPSDSHLLWIVPVLAASLIGLVTARGRGRGVPWRTASATVLLALATLLWPVPHKQGPGPRVILIGLDGATWDLIDPYVSAGRMPNFERLILDCHRAQLRSLKTLLSPQIWSTMATGCLPEVHGIMDFSYRKSNFLVGTLWDRLKLEGRSFGLFGWYFTWPPEPALEHVDFIIPSRIAPDDQTYPPEYSFYRRLEAGVRRGERRGFRSGIGYYAVTGLEAWRHGIRLSTLRLGLAEILARRLTDRTELDNHWRARRLSVSIQGDLFAELLRTRAPEFAASLFTQIDHVSHRYWKYMRPDEFPDVTESQSDRYGCVIEDIYAEVDRALGKILAVVPSDADIVIVSDHGFRSLHQTDAERHCRIRTTELIEALGLADSLFGTNVDEDVLLRATLGSKREKERLLASVESALRWARVVGEDRPLFEVGRDGEMLRLSLASRPAVPEDARVQLGGGEYPFGKVVRARREAFISGGHHRDGIYMLSGPSAGHAVAADSLNVLDVAPTVAALLRLPISPQWTGRPALEGVSLADLGVGQYPPPYEPQPPPTEIDEALKEKLRALGYLE